MPFGISLKWLLIGGGALALFAAAYFWIADIKRDAFAAGVVHEGERVAKIVEENNRTNRAVEKATQAAVDDAAARFEATARKAANDAVRRSETVRTIIQGSTLSDKACDVPQSVVDAKNEGRAAL